MKNTIACLLFLLASAIFAALNFTLAPDGQTAFRIIAILTKSRRIETPWNLNKDFNRDRAKIKCYLGVENCREALHDATFVVNAIQVGGYDPSTIIDFEIPKNTGCGKQSPISSE